MFSKACEYAIRSALYIAINSKEGEKLGLQEIAEEIDSPAQFTAKILQTLVREGIVSSIKGPNGGFYLEPDSKPVALKEIVRAIDNDSIFYSCAIGLKKCSDKTPCAIHDHVKAYKNRLLSFLEDKTLQQLAKESKSKKHRLKK